MIGMSEMYGKPRFCDLGAFLHQAGQGERLPGLHFDGRVDLANRQAGHGDAAE